MWIQCSDGVRLACTLTTPADRSDPAPARYVIINSATGVKRSYYAAFAEHLTSLGMHVLTWDARGIGDSRQGHARESKARMRDWGAVDFEAVLDFVRDRTAGDWNRIWVIGHSSGGHLSGLAASMRHVKHLILVASGTCDWRLYPKKQWPRLLTAWYGLAPLVLNVLKYWPAQLGVGHDLPPGVAWDWRNWSTRKGYLFSDHSLDIRPYQEFSGRLFALHFSDDQDFAPPLAVHDLVDHFPKANATVHEYEPQLKGQKIGHFGFFQKKHAALWPLLEASLNLPA